MPQAPRDLIVRAGNEVRGTQSFVQVMASVFRRPSLVFIEIAWRWTIGVILAGIVGAANRDALPHWIDAAYWRSFGTLLLHGAFVFGVSGTTVLLLGATLVLWAAIAGVARSAILCRLDGTLHPRRGTVVVLTILRVLAFSMLTALWVWALVSIWLRVVASSDPNYVGGFAVAVVLTLVLFMLWSVVSWVVPLAVTLAMARDMGVGESLRAALNSGPLRSKLIEINLVMGIVNIALVVLAMVFSATPLPFQTFTTQRFLWTWWAGVAVVYLLASDFFHVVRLAAGLALCRAYDFQ